MPEDGTRELQAIIEATQEHIRHLRSAGFEAAAKLYAIALLELQTEMHDITDEELEAFCKSLQSKGSGGMTNVIDLATRAKTKAWP